MRILSLLLVGLIYWPINSSSTEIDSTGNLITNTWSGVINSTTITSGENSHTTGSGPTPVYNSDTDTITFSYSQMTVSQIIGINAALSAAGTGIQVRGFSYGWEYYNQDFNRGTLTGNIGLTNSSGQLLENYNYSMPQTVSGWTAMSGTQNFNNIYNPNNLGNLTVSFTGRDDRFWAGYYGPMIRNIDVRLLYSIDPCVADPQSNPNCPGFKTFYDISDDGFFEVNLPFMFSFYGQNFSTSYFQSNGVISFQNSGWGFCCSGPDLTQLGSDTSWNYTLLPLAVDLIAADPSSRFYTQSDITYMRYTWENINQFGTNNLNTFSVEIRPTGYIGFTYDNVNLSYNTVTAGIVGDPTKGEFKQIYHGSGNDFNLTGTYTFTGTEVDQCFVNPLSSESCLGYEQAFYNQQCSADPLYDEGCLGFSEANYSLQCSISPLYDKGCPGHDIAYFDQQCSINPLYDNKCPGYPQAKVLKDQQEKQNEESSTEMTSSDSSTSTASTIDQSLVDPTRTETVVAIDVGGVELSLSGEIAAPTGQTQTAREAAKETEKEEATKEEEKKSNPRAVALARSAAANATRLAESRAQDSVTLSQLDQSVSDAIGLGTGITLQGFRPTGIESEEGSTSDRSSTQNNLNLQAGNDTKSKEVPGSQPPTGPSVRRGGAVEGMEGGASMAELARAPLDFNQYLNSQLKDSRFYESREIYRGQRTVDNARAQRFLNAASDRLHQEMVDQQYGK